MVHCNCIVFCYFLEFFFSLFFCVIPLQFIDWKCYGFNSMTLMLAIWNAFGFPNAFAYELDLNIHFPCETKVLHSFFLLTQLMQVFHDSTSFYSIFLLEILTWDKDVGVMLLHHDADVRKTWCSIGYHDNSWIESL